jgi:predicted DNA-binding protein (MmcQ/YjbR family)
MTRDAFNAYCAAFDHATHVVQWGGADVWKIGGKVFAVGFWSGKTAGITFKTSDMVYEILRDRPGCRPAPYFASRGMKWIQWTDDAMPEADLRGHLADSYDLVAAKLTRAVRRSLGL